jgi:uncharacterized protein YijF (DUF1287 family)
MRRRLLIAAGLAALTAPAAYFALSTTLSDNRSDHHRPSGSKLLDAARRQKNVTRRYDSAYTRLPYPGGDVPRAKGVCTDVVIRAARDGLGLDLQKLVHEDMVKAFAAYPALWGLKAADANIDHRRVPNLETYWRRQDAELWNSKNKAAVPVPLKPGDILTFISWANRPHVAIVVHGGKNARIIHNMGSGVCEQPLWILFGLTLRGHYRWPKA